MLPNTEQITGYRYLLMDIGQITVQITRHTAGYSGQTVSYSGQVRLVSLLYVLLRAYQLTVTIIFNC